MKRKRALDHVGLSAEAADEQSLQKSYWRKSVSTSASFKRFCCQRRSRVEDPAVTVGSVATPAKNTTVHQCPVEPETAPAWNVRNILQLELPHIKDAVKGFVPYLEEMPKPLDVALRELAVGEEYTCRLRGVEQVPEGWFHGTSWLGAEEILKSGFLPSYGAGRCKDPLVYSSPNKSYASNFPMAMVDDKRNQCGEVVACDTAYLRVVLTCTADMSKRQVKIRRKHNKQDAFPKECMSVRAVTFMAFGTAPLEQLQHYHLTALID